MENILNSINGSYVSLNATEQKRNNVIVHAVLNTVIQSLSTDKLFKALYNKNYFGGSYYDNLKVGSSDEFDIDLLFVLPENLSPTINSSDKPGYVHVTLSDLEKLEEKFKGLEKLCNPITKQISARKVLSWFESLSAKCFNKLCPRGNVLQTVSVQGKAYDIKVKLTKSGPASTINIVAEALDKSVIKIDVDLVPCISFSKKYWPSKSAGYRQYDSKLHGNSETFFVVPKLPTGTAIPDFYWRLSFQEQERVLISGNELGRLKPVLRLLKRVRDHWNHPISSYFIKTVFLWEVETRSKDFWNRPLSIVFCAMLEVYGEKLKNGAIPYFWNKKFNLLSGFKKSTLDGIANKINNIVSDVKRFSEIDPFVVAKHIEVEILRREVPIGKKKGKVPIEASSQPTVSNYSSGGGSRAESVVSSSTSSSSYSEEQPSSSTDYLGLVAKNLDEVRAFLQRIVLKK
ncbi:hypothetical protein WA026_014554 [Henosepilachna vigintioctopunctata]|uniref:Uncharacterized protein n=1 Tax=Henosepilachna vigintioctopunctata TaxID=420089 RepID=A0AAW1V6I2_9CUCU